MKANAMLPYLGRLIFNVYLFGYKNQGESIIFTLVNDFGVAYSGVIDCFEGNSGNETVKFLDKLGIEYLDILCWTHPHEDHSLGIDVLLTDYISEKTRIVFPNGLNQLEYNYDDIRISNSIDIINAIVLSKKHAKPKIRPVCDVSHIDRRQIGNKFQNSYELEITSITPISEIIEKRELLGKLYTFNDYSIALLISIGGVNFMFGGDIQDTSIRKVEDFAIPPKLDYVKIPHHSSEHSLELRNWLNVGNKSSISCTTEYASSNLPRKSVLEEYKVLSKEIYCTNSRGSTNDYGIVHTVYDVLSKTFYSETFGSAYLYSRNDDLSVRKLI